MLCENCGKEVLTIECAGCGAQVIKLGPYCYLCGAKLLEKKEDTDDLDFSSRVLCSDGSCIGVINEQGFCKVCGKPYKPEAD